MIDLRLFAGACRERLGKGQTLVTDLAESVHPGHAVGRDVTLISLPLQPQDPRTWFRRLSSRPLICPPRQHGLASPDTTPESKPRLAFNSDMSSPPCPRAASNTSSFVWRAHETKLPPKGEPRPWDLQGQLISAHTDDGGSPSVSSSLGAADGGRRGGGSIIQKGRRLILSGLVASWLFSLSSASSLSFTTVFLPLFGPTAILF